MCFFPQFSLQSLRLVVTCNFFGSLSLFQFLKLFGCLQFFSFQFVCSLFFVCWFVCSSQFSLHLFNVVIQLSSLFRSKVHESVNLLSVVELVMMLILCSFVFFGSNALDNDNIAWLWAFIWGFWRWWLVFGAVSCFFAIVCTFFHAVFKTCSTTIVYSISIAFFCQLVDLQTSKWLEIP